MIAEKDPYIANAAKTLYRASADERIQNFCEGREEGEKRCGRCRWKYSSPR